MSTPDSSIQVLSPKEGESFDSLLNRILETDGEILLLLTGKEASLLAETEKYTAFFGPLAAVSARIRIATKHPILAEKLRSEGMAVIERTKHLKVVLSGNPREQDALHLFSPQLWRQQLKSKLQGMGLLSVPKLRIFSLAVLSCILFYIVVFRLLPSAEVSIKSRQEPVSQTINIFLVSSGATAEVAPTVRQMDLITFEVEKSLILTIDHISKEFIGTSATVPMTIVNNTDEPYELREGTRFQSPNGLLFRLTHFAIIEPKSEVTVLSKADDVDLYGEIIGDRGNVPAGMRFDIPGLASNERTLVYGKTQRDATGGTSAYRTVLRNEDLDLARKRLEQELLTQVKKELEAQKDARNNASSKEFINLLNAAQYEKDLIKIEYRDITLPYDLIGQEVSQLQVSGSIYYRVFGYDAHRVLLALKKEMIDHVQEGRRLISDNIAKDQMVAYVIDFSDSLSWIKLTVELNASEEYVLEPLTAEGALFAKQVRELVAGLSREEALRKVRNLPEVERVSIRQWPPWQHQMPSIPAHISVSTE